MKQKVLRKLLVIALLLTGFTAYAHDFEVDGIYYTITSDRDKTVKVTFKGDFEYNAFSYSGDIIIPSEVSYYNTTYSVTKIGDYAFQGCDDLTNVSIPNSIISIGDHAFWDCTSLTSISLPNSITNIGELVFAGCNNLTSIIIPNTVTSIGVAAFSGCEKLTSITLPNSITNIGEQAFMDCIGLTSITIPNSVISIGLRAFNGCCLTSIVVDSGNPIYDSRDNCNAIIKTGINALIVGCRNTIIPNSVTSIDDRAFSHCNDLTLMTIPNSVTLIGEAAFSYCENLTSIIIPNSITNVGFDAFCGCEKLVSVSIGNSVISIGDFAFAECENLTSITIPASVKYIGEGAFDCCSSSLTSIVVDKENTIYDSRNSCNALIETASNTLFLGCKNTIIPTSVTSIGESAFSGCEDLVSITLPNSITNIGNYAFYECLNLTSVSLGNTVTSIGKCAFSYCENLTSITIPASVSNIGNWAFECCDNLTNVTCLNNTPPNLDDFVFDDISPSAILYVPEGSKEAYSTSIGWSNFGTIVEILTDYLTIPSVELFKGKSISIPVTMNNLNEFTAFQCDLNLPKGVTCSKVSLSDRASDHSITKYITSDGIVKIAALSFTSSPFTENDGVLFNVEITASEDITDGEYIMALKNIKFSTVDATEYNLAEASAKLTLKSYIKGDANGDGNISITDAVTIVNYFMGNIPSSFVFAAADINESGDISITDAVGTINILLSQSVSVLSSNTTKKIKTTPTIKAILPNEGNSLYIDNFVVTPGMEKNVYLYMDNTTEYCAFSADIHLPEGVSITNKVLTSERSVDHMLSTSTPADNVLRLAALSFSNANFIGLSGTPIVELTLSIDDNFIGGNIIINNVELTTATMDYCKPEETITQITIDDPTAVTDIHLNANNSVEYYNLQGVKVENPEKGIYIKRQGGKSAKVVLWNLSVKNKNNLVILIHP